MSAKIPKRIKEITFQISPKNGLVINYIREKPVKIFSKPVQVESKKKISPKEVVSFNIAGTIHYVKTAAKLLLSMNGIINMILMLALFTATK